MSCNPNPPLCTCSNPATWIMATVGEVRNLPLCSGCTDPLAAFTIAVFFGEVRTECKQLCIEQFRLFYNVRYFPVDPTVIGIATCGESIPLEVKGVDFSIENPTPCTLAPRNTLCTNTRLAHGGFILYFCDFRLEFAPLGIDIIQYGTDGNGLTSTRIIWTLNHPCVGNITMFIMEICYRNHSPMIDPFNLKEDYEALKGLTIGSMAWENDIAIQIARKMRLLP